MGHVLAIVDRQYLRRAIRQEVDVLDRIELVSCFSAEDSGLTYGYAY
jgi:hypothetical protein